MRNRACAHGGVAISAVFASGATRFLNHDHTKMTVRVLFD
jgi:hypothetical protein